MFCSPAAFGAGDGDNIDSSALECDYDTNVTTLYQAIESEAWVPVLEFLETGKWEHMFRSDPMIPSKQAQTWVTRFDDGKVRWSLLPIHLALIKSAPPKIISRLLDLHPLGAKSVDDQGSLPLHMAFKYGACDRVVIDLIQRFPTALFTKDMRERVPTDIDGREKERTVLLRAAIKAATAHIESKQRQAHEKQLSKFRDNLTVQQQAHETKLGELRDDLSLLRNLNTNLEREKKEAERRLTRLKEEFLKLRKENRTLLDQQKTLNSERHATPQQVNPPRPQSLLRQQPRNGSVARSVKESCPVSVVVAPKITETQQLGCYKNLRVIDNATSRRSVPQSLAVEPARSSNDISTRTQASPATESRSDNESVQQRPDRKGEELTSFAATVRRGSTRRRRRTNKKLSSKNNGPILGYKSTWTGKVAHIPEPHPGTRPRKTHGFFGGFSAQQE